MHRAYQPVKPASSKLLAKHWDDELYSRHRKRVKNQKSCIDNKPPRTYMHLHLKLKKLQLEEERLATIERDNRILLEKMSRIMRSGGAIDNRNDYEHKSLNKSARQRELLRITHENQAILKRIQTREPAYHYEQWEDEYTVQEGYAANIRKYPTEEELELYTSRTTNQSPVRKILPPISSDVHAEEDTSTDDTQGNRESEDQKEEDQPEDEEVVKDENEHDIT
eukprot:UC4_evm6s1162